MNTSSILSVSLAALLLTFTSACSNVKPSPVPAAIQPYVEKNEIAGAVTVVASADKILAIDTVGFADVAQKKPMQSDNIFWIASMTKPVTAAAVLMLQDEGKLNINDPVAKYIPQFASLQTPSGKPANLTLRHLLTHTSGLVEASREQEIAAVTLSDLIPVYLAKPTQFEPGSKWQYCQSSINTAARVVEIVAGQPFPEFLEQRFFKPLGMKDTTFYPTTAQLPRIAKTYKQENGQLVETPIAFLGDKALTSRDRYPRANGGLFSTGPDYVRFCQMLLNKGSFHGKQYLKPETVKFMTKLQTGALKTGFTNGNGWGIGVCMIRQPQGLTAMLSPGTFGHGGAYGTQAWIDPVQQRIYLLMVQRSNFPNSDASEVRQAFQEAAVKAFAKQG